MDNNDRKCPNGHMWTPENRMVKDKSGKTRCRPCFNDMRRSTDPEHQARYAAKKSGTWAPADPKVQGKARREKHKALVLAAYGDVCACCGESLPMLLTIDHVNNNGSAHRKEMGNSSRVYDWLIKSGFPEGFQVLCWNCNIGKHMNGGTHCPHLDG